jgi:cell shape-determining protein MreC
MKYQFRDKKSIERKRLWVKGAIISFIVLTLFLTGVVSMSGGVFNFLGKPIWKSRNAIIDAVDSSAHIVRTKKSVFTENEELNRRLIEQNLAMTDYQILKSENEELKSLIGRFPKNHSFVLGNVLVRPSQSPYDTLIIDIGTNFAIKEGSRVFANAVIPIGYVSHVYADSALVSLYSNPSETTEVMISGSDASVELIGRGGGNFEMSVPVELDSSRGTTVLLPGSSTLVIAVMEDVISNPTDPVKKVLLRSPVNVQQLKWVQVEK